jgi:CO/xanthine dehydrogenase Mo-binding subunit
MENMIKNETRRDFLKVSGTVAGGLALGFYLPGRHNVAVAAETTSSPNAWVKIAPDNTVTIMVARSEMGQDVYTSMPILVAEELEVDLSKVKVEFAPPGRGLHQRAARRPTDGRLHIGARCVGKTAQGRRIGSHDAGNGGCQ